jgi:multiple sugar transport system permease protein
VAPIRGWMHRLGTALLQVVLGVMAVYFLLPVYWLLVSATKSDTALFAGSGLWLSAHLALGENLADLFSQSGDIFLRWIANSIFYSGSVAVLGTALAGMTGYALSMFEFRGKSGILYGILTSLMVPSAALVVPIFLMDHALHLINTYWGVILPLAASPFGAFFMYVYMRGAIPPELLDAARVDGASEWRTMWSIVPHLVSPGLATLLLLLFIGTWNNFFLPLVVLSNENIFPVSLGLSVWNATAGAASEGHAVYSLVITGALVSVVPLVLLFFVARRYIMRGLAFGGLVM